MFSGVRHQSFLQSWLFKEVDVTVGIADND